MASVFAHQGGEILSLVETHGAVTEYIYVVPGGKKWTLLTAYIERDVNATLDLFIRDPNLQVLWQITQLAAGVTNPFLPSDLPQIDEREVWCGKLLQLGGFFQVRIVWGVAQTTPVTRLMVLEE